MSGASDAMADRTVLPTPDPEFRGRIEVAFKDSEAAFPEPVKPPDGAPNVLLIMGDDVGYGHTRRQHPLAALYLTERAAATPNLTADPEERHNRVTDDVGTLSRMQSVLDGQREEKRLLPSLHNPAG